MTTPEVKVRDIITGETLQQVVIAFSERRVRLLEAYARCHTNGLDTGFWAKRIMQVNDAEIAIVGSLF